MMMMTMVMTVMTVDDDDDDDCWKYTVIGYHFILVEY